MYATEYIQLALIFRGCQCSGEAVASGDCPLARRTLPIDHSTPDGKLKRLTVSSRKYERIAITISNRNCALPLVGVPGVRLRVCSPCFSLNATFIVASGESEWNALR
jgi:hypothetical protein